MVRQSARGFKPRGRLAHDDRRPRLTRARLALVGASASLSLLAWPLSAWAQREIDLFGGEPAAASDVAKGQAQADPAQADPNKAAKGKAAKGKAAKGDGDQAAAGIKVGSAIEVSASGAQEDQSGQTLTLRFKRQGLAMFVEAKLQGKPVYFMVDTGAGYTAIRPSVARQAGVSPPAGAPRAVFHTANGPVEAPFGLIPSLTLGGRRHSNVTYSICETCGQDSSPWGPPIAGLLGMNVLKRYTMTIDEARGVLELSPGLGYHDREADVRPWLEFDRPTLRPKYARGPLIFEVKARNKAPVHVQEATLEVECQGGASTARRAQGALRAQGTMSVELAATCQPTDWRLSGLRW